MNRPNTTADLERLFDFESALYEWQGSVPDRHVGRSKYDGLACEIADALLCEGYFDSRRFDLALTTRELRTVRERMWWLAARHSLFQEGLFQKIRVSPPTSFRQYFVVLPERPWTG